MLAYQKHFSRNNDPFVGWTPPSQPPTARTVAGYAASLPNPGPETQYPPEGI
jgi:hypothetical protein